MNIDQIRFCTMIIVLMTGAWVQASDNAVTVIPAEGNKQCSDYASNSLIQQMGANAPGSVGTLVGPENPRDTDTTGESATYVLSNGTVASFSASTTPVDYAILRSSKFIALFIYPSGGVKQDANMKLMVNGQPQSITGISLCYGLGNVAPPPPPAATIPSCEVLNASQGGIDGVGIVCPSNGERSLIFNLELDKSLYNTANSPVACVCNSAALTECDPGVAAGELNACPDPASATKLPTEVTTHIELNNDPYFCTTVAGVRKCYSY